MQPAPRPLSEQPLGEPPLPPATTRHVESAEPAEEATMAAPFLPGASTPHAAAGEWTAHAPATEPLPEIAPGDASEPLPWEEPAAPASESNASRQTWDGVPTVEPESFQVSEPGAEPIMPWEEYLSLDRAVEPLEPGAELGDITNLTAAAAGAASPQPDPWAELAPADPGWTLPLSEQETGEASPPWGSEPGPVEAAGFPLDAFIVPTDAHHPSGTEDGLREQAEALAVRLEALAARLRVEGFIPLVRPTADAQPIDQLIATLLAGYISR
jgi:hypothetical protein